VRQSIHYRLKEVKVPEKSIFKRRTATALAFSLAIVENLVGKETAERVKKATLVS